MSELHQLLVESFHVSPSELSKALEYQQKYGGKLEQILVNMGALPDDQVTPLLSQYLQVPILDLTQWLEEPIVELNESTIGDLVKWGCYPLSWNSGSLHVACKDPLLPELNEWLAETEAEIEYYLATEYELKQLFSRHQTTENDITTANLTGDEEERLREMASEAPTVNLLNSLISKALRQNASDMHLEPYDGFYRVRYRIDGVLHEVEKLPRTMQMPLTTRLKILSGMDIAEKRRPQDGKIELKIANQEVDIRVSALPVNEGESIVMRFLRKDNVKYDLSVIGLSEDVETQIRRDIKTTAGVVLLTGPTGSGKTTTLYTFLNALNNTDVKIITLEDPVEYQLDGINQVQVQSDIGFDFAAGLRSIVRQDPDVIMLGEIRDKETAQIALQSALTGHLVFSTVHTNDAASAYTRLLDLGVEEFLLNAALVSIVAQRLARKICPHCSAPVDNADELFERFELQQFCEKFEIDQVNLRHGEGCEHCAHTGYKGRMAVTEYLGCDSTIKSLPKDANFIPLAKQHNASLKRRTLVEDGIYKAIHGLTTIEEVMRVAG
ncbi:type II secretion system protein GspE [Pseudoalteromonas sp. GCY]|uniref:GspE/PulE family protein n=1 Tax=Pseudoalteromonas sp. GCY TaxID=2003316 RepID=UPI000BFEDD57|nr:type II/IV secretion system protein [Pseudoalteromonas sp. GCY]PHI38623.1 type II secretion system protein GspE [Pseudoalteromonas sp. GCY]QQQ67716.1 type II/IV secretion system protein [Pseudoalteromonas sp. GCY]